MTKKDVIEFFDKCAPSWDAEMIRDDAIIDTILNHAQVTSGKDILDVACGTGVLIPDYLKRNVKSVTAIDISPEMAKYAAKKFAGEKVEVICGDVETEMFHQKFDCIMVYNAFPHFQDPENLIRVLSTYLKEDGTLTVAHGMSRVEIDNCHTGSASKVSNGLMDEEELAEIFQKYLQVTVKISNHKMYQVTGIRV